MDAKELDIIKKGFSNITNLLKETNKILEKAFKEINEKLGEIRDNTFSISLSS